MKPLHQIKAGVIGTGFIGPVHIEALKRLGIQVAAVCGSTKSATAVADRFGIPQVFGDYDYKKMIRESGVDVIHITSPNKDHFAQAKAVMAAGLHCVCRINAHAARFQTVGIGVALITKRIIFGRVDGCGRQTC